MSDGEATGGGVRLSVENAVIAKEPETKTIDGKDAAGVIESKYVQITAMDGHSFYVQRKFTHVSEALKHYFDPPPKKKKKGGKKKKGKGKKKKAKSRNKSGNNIEDAETSESDGYDSDSESEDEVEEKPLDQSNNKGLKKGKKGRKGGKKKKKRLLPKAKGPQHSVVFSTLSSAVVKKMCDYLNYAGSYSSGKIDVSRLEIEPEYLLELAPIAAELNM